MSENLKGSEQRHLTPALSPVEAERERRPVRRLGPETEAVPVEERSVGQMLEVSRDNQARIRLEYDARELALEQGLSEAETGRVVAATRTGFRLVDGAPVPVLADRQTVAMVADGSRVLTLGEWVGRMAGGLKAGTSNVQHPTSNIEWEGGEVLPVRNPFRRRTWNLTEQMRLMRRDPPLARRLEAEAEAEGES